MNERESPERAAQAMTGFSVIPFWKIFFQVCNNMYLMKESPERIA
jgi:hypothetical protein